MFESICIYCNTSTKSQLSTTAISLTIVSLRYPIEQFFYILNRSKIATSLQQLKYFNPEMGDCTVDMTEAPPISFFLSFFVILSFFFFLSHLHALPFKFINYYLKSYFAKA